MAQSRRYDRRGGCGADENEPESIDTGRLHVYSIRRPGADRVAAWLYPNAPPLADAAIWPELEGSGSAAVSSCAQRQFDVPPSATAHHHTTRAGITELHNLAGLLLAGDDPDAIARQIDEIGHLMEWAYHVWEGSALG